MSRSAKAASGFATSVFQYISQILVQALLAPVVLQLAGREALGAYAAINQTLTFISLVDVVHSWTLERYLAQATGAADGGEQFRQTFTIARTLMLVSNTIIAILIVILSFFVGPLYGLSLDIALQAQHALWVIAAWNVLRTPLAAYLNASIATQDLAANNLIGAFLGFLRASASLVFVLFGTGLFGLMLAGTLAEALGSILYRWRFRRLHGNLMPRWGVPDWARLWEMVSFGWQAMLLNVGNLLLYSSGSAIAALTNGAAVASTFYTSQMPAMTLSNMVMRLPDSVAPAINQLCGQQDEEPLRNAFIRLTRIILLFALPLAAGTIIFNRDLVVAWVGLPQYAGGLFTVSLALFCVILIVQRQLIVYSFAFGWIRLLMVTALLQGAANLALAFYLTRFMGLSGITIALLISTIPQTIILWLKVTKRLGVDTRDLIVDCFKRVTIPLVLASAAGLLAQRLFTVGYHDIMGLLFVTAPFGLTYTAIAYSWSIEPRERDAISGKVRQIFKALSARIGTK
ncbi:MAG: hypothetical protein P4L87_26380 [Formivibrio sp.]|nr:hypothetical protein [Formivibrio sp.]